MLVSSLSWILSSEAFLNRTTKVMDIVIQGHDLPTNVGLHHRKAIVHLRLHEGNLTSGVVRKWFQPSVIADCQGVQLTKDEDGLWMGDWTTDKDGYDLDLLAEAMDGNVTIDIAGSDDDDGTNLDGGNGYRCVVHI